MLTQTIILSATKYTVKPTVYAMQGDTGRVLNCAFSDFTVPEGATARLYIHRPNGTFYTETATVDGQVVTVDADQVLTTAGYVNCDLEIEADNETVQSFPFTVRVLATEAGSPQTTEKGVSVAELDERVTALENAPQGAAWGEITGDIADQTDLKNALEGKADGAVYDYDIDTGDATINASGAVEVQSNDSIETTAPTQEFRAVSGSPEYGYSLKIDANDGLKKGTLDPETGEWNYEEIGGGKQLYMHSLAFGIGNTANQRFTCTIISDSATEMDSLAVYNWLNTHGYTGNNYNNAKLLQVSGADAQSKKIGIGLYVNTNLGNKVPSIRYWLQSSSTLSVEGVDGIFSDTVVAL